MKKITVTTFALSAVALMSGCGGSDGDGSPPGGAGADPISIVTVTGAQHVLTGVHATACYDDGGSGRIDVLTVTGAEWTNESNIYGSTDCSGGINRSGKTIANIAGVNNNTQTSGWKGQGDIAPQRADATGSLNENETITPFDIEVTAVIDPTQLFGGNVNIGFKATAFYVFDDTAGGDTYVMYRDDDGVFASASDPYVFTTHGTGSQLTFPVVVAISGNEFDLAGTNWTRCFTFIGEGPVDIRESVSVSASAPFVITTTDVIYPDSGNGTCTTGEFDSTTVITYDAVSNGTVSISSWVDIDENIVGAPQKQDGSQPLSDTESYSEIAATVTSDSSFHKEDGEISSFGYIVDDSTGTPVIYFSPGGIAVNIPLLPQIQ